MVLALLALQAGIDTQIGIILDCVVMVVFCSVMLHGLTAPLIGRAVARREPADATDVRPEDIRTGPVG
ncbi:hypothetical protein [Kocuria sp. KD4]|uniref:hypothetical protein n=1 Tax=Kocuria sp. KD4 TaxID=2719588 RepID=UPI001427941B|nr:hypothetical protein [Kocuria sp. KD4]QIR69568.1 hypothetical protein HBK84_05410 [Kocuria sp. KD4]